MAPDGPLAGAVIAFDLDGTLVDTAPDLVGTLNVLLAEAGHPPRPLAEARAFIGRGARWLIERGFQSAGVRLQPQDIQTQFERFLVHYEAHIADQSRPFPGCLDALDALSAAGARLCVCTNKLTGLSNRLLAELDMARRFAAVIGSDSTPAIKPDPRHLLAAVDAVGGQIGRTIMVGDAATDAGAARAAGAHLILVDFGYTETPAAELGADILISHFDDLPGACARLLGACGPGTEQV